MAAPSRTNMAIDRARARARVTCTYTLLSALLCTSASAGVLHDIANEVSATLAALRAAHAPKPPVPVAVKWRPTKLTPSFALGAPFFALAAAVLVGVGLSVFFAV